MVAISLHEPRGMPTGAARAIETQCLATPPGSSISEFHDASDDQQESKLQKCWDKSIAKHMDLPDGYHNIHVLMVKWHDDIDQLRVASEVAELTNVFESIFMYSVTKVELEESKPQQQLDMEITAWIFKYDSPGNLLIVYYGGHGVYDLQTKALEILPSDKDEAPRVSWSRSEKPFVETVKADVFLIMDCCYASDLLRDIPEWGRTFEMLAASHIGQTTAQPGPNSFTRCLINHLKELADSSAQTFFTTWDILERMQRERGVEAPALWRRIPGSSRHIRLRKLKPVHERPKVSHDRPQYSQFLHLGFALKHECLREPSIEFLTRELPKLFARAHLPLVNVKWLGCRKTSSSRLREAVELYMVKNRADSFSCSPVTGRKRSIDVTGFDDEVEDRPKRNNLPDLVTESAV